MSSRLEPEVEEEEGEGELECERRAEFISYFSNLMTTFILFSFSFSYFSLILFFKGHPARLRP